MITALEINNPADSGVPWWKDCKHLPQSGKLEFGPGINVLFGANGSGKSAILQALARSLHCHQGGMQAVSQTSLGFEGGEKFGLLPRHDGGPVLFHDPGQAAGLIGGGFDDDFFSVGLSNAMFKGSAGQTTLMRGQSALDSLFRDVAVPPLDWKLGKELVTRRYPDVVSFLAGNIEGPASAAAAKVPTLLLDEPERSLSLPYQQIFWEKVLLSVFRRRKKNPIQVIVATHSIFALDLPVHYIEVEPGSLKAARDAIEQSWVAAKLMGKAVQEERRRAQAAEVENTTEEEADVP